MKFRVLLTVFTIGFASLLATQSARLVVMFLVGMEGQSLWWDWTNER